MVCFEASGAVWVPSAHGTQAGVTAPPGSFLPPLGNREETGSSSWARCQPGLPVSGWGASLGMGGRGCHVLSAAVPLWPAQCLAEASRSVTSCLWDFSSLGRRLVP